MSLELTAQVQCEVVQLCILSYILTYLTYGSLLTLCILTHMLTLLMGYLRESASIMHTYSLTYVLTYLPYL